MASIKDIGFAVEYSEMNENMFTLKCTFPANAVYTREEMLYWLEYESGLPEEYFEKVTHVKCDAENSHGFDVIFHESVNCLIALREMKNCVIFGKHGKSRITVRHPRADFRIFRLQAISRKLFTKNEIIDAVRPYGEIIEIEDAIWHDNLRKHKIPTGDLDVHILTKKQLPDTLDFGGENLKLRCLVSNLYADEIMRSLWNNLQLNLEIDYKYKIFKLADKQAGCSLVCEFHKEGELPSPRDVYEWLMKESGLTEEYVKKIVAFKMICESQYEILFDSSVNCLLALTEIQFNKVYDAQDVYSVIEVSCPKGRFEDVTLTRINAEEMLLKKDVEDCMKDFGIVIKCGRSRADLDSTGLLKYEIQCKIFRTKIIPEMLKINEISVKVTVADCEKEVHEEELLCEIWNELQM